MTSNDIYGIKKGEFKVQWFNTKFSIDKLKREIMSN